MKLRVISLSIAALSAAGCLPRYQFTDAPLGDATATDAPEASSPDAQPEDAARADAQPADAAAACVDNPISRLTLGEGVSCAIRARGSMYCWGAVVPPGGVMEPVRAVPMRIAADGASIVAAAVEHDFMCVVTSPGGGVLCWGSNTYGQLGAHTSMPHFDAPTRVPTITNVTDIASSSQHVCAIANGAGGPENNQVFCWGAQTEGRTGPMVDSDRVHVPRALTTLMGARELRVEGTLNIARVGGFSQVFAWGTSPDWNFPGEASRTIEPKLVAPSEQAGLFGLSERHACYVSTTGGNQLRCIGDNTLGAVGSTAAGTVSTWDSVADGVSVNPLLLAVGGHASGVARNRAFTCVVPRDAANTVRCWGSNSEGQLGAALALTNSRVPVTVPLSVPAGESITILAAAGAHACVRTSRDQVLCWGRNCEGESGDPVNTGAGGSCEAPRGIAMPTRVDVPCN